MSTNNKSVFPAPELLKIDSSNADEVRGITLRDYFASKAMQATLTTNDCYPDENWRIGIAMDAYKMADAMLEVQERGE